MIKKLLTVSAVAALAVLSSQAQAAATAITDSSTITQTDCSALANNVKVELSENVVAAYNCDDWSFVAATCHTNGTNKSQTVAAQYDASSNLLPGYTGCDASGQCTFVGRIGFRGWSQGGRVGAVPMGDSTCSSTGLVDLTPDSMLTGG